MYTRQLADYSASYSTDNKNARSFILIPATQLQSLGTTLVSPSLFLIATYILYLLITWKTISLSSCYSLSLYKVPAIFNPQVP
jgi:hypothetical protein